MKALLETRGNKTTYNFLFSIDELSSLAAVCLQRALAGSQVGPLLAALYLAQRDPAKLRQMTNDLREITKSRPQKLMVPLIDFIEAAALLRIQHMQTTPEDFNKSNEQPRT